MNVFFWSLWVLAFFALEAWGLKSATDQWPTLSALVRLLPRSVTAIMIGWLAWHFNVADMVKRILDLPLR